MSLSNDAPRLISVLGGALLLPLPGRADEVIGIGFFVAAHFVGYWPKAVLAVAVNCTATNVATRLLDHLVGPELYRC